MCAEKKQIDWWAWLLIGVVLAVVILLFLPVLYEGGQLRGPRLARTKAELAMLKAALGAYHGEYGQYPSGDPATIFRALTDPKDRSQNPKGILFLEIRRDQVDDSGRFIDVWGHPFVIETTNKAKSITIRSLGPDGKDNGGKEDDLEQTVP